MLAEVVVLEMHAGSLMLKKLLELLIFGEHWQSAGRSTTSEEVALDPFAEQVSFYGCTCSQLLN